MPKNDNWSELIVVYHLQTKLIISIKIKNSEKEREHQKVQNHLQLEPEFSQLICFMVLNNDIEDNLIKGEAEDQHHWMDHTLVAC